MIDWSAEPDREPDQALEEDAIADAILAHDLEALADRRKWGPHWCDRCSLYFHQDECPACKLDELQAELQRCADLAGEALGTEPALRTAEGCVAALAKWSGQLCEDLRTLVDERDRAHARLARVHALSDLAQSP